MNDISFYLNIGGLSLNIVGVILLFYTGLPAKAYDDAQYVGGEETQALKWVRYISRIALILLVVGSILQIASAVVSHTGSIMKSNKT
jgi:hypothetical protein